MKNLFSAGRNRWRRIKEAEEGGEKTLDIFIIQILFGISVAVVVSWLWTGYSIGEYGIAIKWMFKLGEFASIGIALALGIFGVLCYLLMFMIGVTHGGFGLPDSTYVLFSIFGATAWVIAILILIASLGVVIANQIT